MYLIKVCMYLQELYKYVQVVSDTQIEWKFS